MNRKCAYVILISFFLICSLSNKASAEYPQKQQGTLQAKYPSDEIILKLKVIPPKIIHKPNGVIETGLPSIDIINSKFGVNSMTKILEKHEVLANKYNKLNLFKQHGLDRIYLIKLQRDSNINEIIKEFNSDNNVEYAEPNYIFSTALTPNDPEFSKLWGLHNTGQFNGKIDADIDVPEAWDIQISSDNIIIAVIDTGIDYNHQDLAANIWTNSKEIPANNIDDDNNGFIDDILGWDFSSCDTFDNSGFCIVTKLPDNDPMDDDSHGTHVSGTIAAVGNNGIGITGVNWRSKIMALKFLNKQGKGYTSDAIKAVQYATLMGAKIMSNSWGGGGYSQALYDAISAANNAGILFVAAAGNDNLNNDINPVYPASYDVLNVISVAATDYFDEKASFSNYGLLSVDIAAPGSSIYSTMPNNLYGYKSGTSMATPHVSGVFALVFSKNPELSIQEARSIVEDSSDNIASDQPIGGRLNAYNALYIRSKIINDGPSLIKGYLLLKSQIFSGGSWQDIGPNINDLASNYQRTIEPTNILNIRQLYNNLNFIPNEQGNYRVLAKFTDRYGNVINTNNGPLEDTFEFNVITTTTSTTTTSTSISTTSVLKSNFYAVGDTYVDESNPTLYFGSNTILLSSGELSSRKVLYLKFDVNLLYKDISNVQLKIRNANDGCIGEAPNYCIEFGELRNTSWNEYFINWDNKPPIDTLLEYRVNSDTNVEHIFHISPIRIKNNGSYAFAISSQNSDLTKWYSRESAYKPRLEIYYFTTTTSTTTTRLSTTSIPGSTNIVFRQGENGYTGSTDTLIRQIAPNTNYASFDSLNIMNSATNSYYSFIFYDISNIPDNAIINSATLMFRTYNICCSPGATVGLHKLLTPEVNLASATYNTKDGINPWTAGSFSNNDYALVALTSGIAPSVLNTPFNITGTDFANYLQQELNSNMIRIVLVHNGATDSLQAFSSNNAGAITNRPKLFVGYTT